MSQPSITISALNAYGVYLFPSTAPEFTQALSPARPKELDVLLPYAVLIKNDTDKEIIGYSVRWNCRDASGNAGAPEVNRFDFSTFSSVIAPHGSQLVSSSIGPISAEIQWSGDLQGETERLVSYYSRQQNIAVRLDAVLFKDGTAIGLDGNNWISRWKAHIDAEREVYGLASRAEPAELRA